MVVTFFSKYGCYLAVKLNNVTAIYRPLVPNCNPY